MSNKKNIKLHVKRDRFLRVLIGTGIMAHDKELALKSLRESGSELTEAQEKELKEASDAVDYVNRTGRALGKRGVDCRRDELSEIPDGIWPSSAQCAEIALELMEIHARVDYGAQHYDFDQLDLESIDMKPLDVRKFPPFYFRVKF